MTSTTNSTKTRLAEYFRYQLNSPEIAFVHANTDPGTTPPYGVVTITKLEETTPRSNVHRATILITVVDDIDNSTSDGHDALLQQVMLALDKIPRRGPDSNAEINLFGWTITGVETVTNQESNSFSDEITIVAGCGG